jgi:hypothetical protein
MGAAMRTLLTVVLALSLAAPAAASDEVRVDGSCGAGARSQLRLRADDGSIRVEFRVRSAHSGESWRVTLVHERRVAWRGVVRTSGNGSARVRRSVADYEGADRISVRAAGPRGNVCQAGATLTGDSRH